MQANDIMIFYNSSQLMQEKLEKVFIRLTEQGYTSLQDSISLTWLSYREHTKDEPYGISWAAKRLFHLGDLVNLFHGIAVELWLQRQWLESDTELLRIMDELGPTTSSSVSSLIVDLLTGNSSGLKIHDNHKQDWYEQRQLLNFWLRELEWSELAGGNICQKIWLDGTFGAERQLCGVDYQNRNRLSTGAMARFLHTLITNELYSPLICQRIRSLFNLNFDKLEYSSNQGHDLQGRNILSLNIVSFGQNTYHKLVFAHTRNGALNIIIIFNENRTLVKDVSIINSLINQLLN